jgi:hypothetical protein
MSWLFWYFPLSSHLHLFQCEECEYLLSWFCCTHVVFSYTPLYLPIVTFPLASSFLSIFISPVFKIPHFCSYPVLPVLTVSLVFIKRHVPRTCPMSYVVCPCPRHVDSGPRIEWNLESPFFLSSFHTTSWRRPKSGSLFSPAPALCFSLALPECLLDHLSVPCIFFVFTGTPFIGRFNRSSSDDSSQASPSLPFLPALCSPCCHFLARFSHCCHF